MYRVNPNPSLPSTHAVWGKERERIGLRVRYLARENGVFGAKKILGKCLRNGKVCVIRR